MTLWNLSCEICTPVSSYLSQAVLWTSECKAVSLSVHTPTLPSPPSHFLCTQTKAASLGKELGHLCSCVEAKPARLVVGVSAYKAQSTSVKLLPDGTRRSKITSSKNTWLNSPKQSTFPQESARDEALLCSQNPKGSVHHYPPALIWLSARRSGGFPQVASHCLNKLLVKHVSNARQASTGDPSSPSKQ